MKKLGLLILLMFLASCASSGSRGVQEANQYNGQYNMTGGDFLFVLGANILIVTTNVTTEAVLWRYQD